MHSSPNEIIRQTRPEDIPALGALFQDAFGEPRNEAIWRWKYFDNPRGVFTYVCEAGGAIVAHCGGTPQVVTDGSSRYVALQSVDFSSTRRYPGGIGAGGVFARTVAAFFARYCGPAAVPLLYGFPGERHRVFGEKILGYRAVEPVGEVRLEPEGDGAELPPLDASNLALLSQAPPAVGGLRDRTYARWRYLEHPTARYQVAVTKRGLLRSPEMIAVVRDVGDRFMLMELEGSYGVLALQRMVRLLRSLGKPVVGWASLAHERTRGMIEAGFSGGERDHRFECRYFTPRQPFRTGEFYYSLGDYDVY